jgi:hypothetical protein
MRKSLVIAIGAATVAVTIAGGVAATAAPRIADGGSTAP